MSGSLAVRSSWPRYYGKRMSEYADNWRCERNQSGVSEAIERVCRQAGVSARELQAGQSAKVGVEDSSLAGTTASGRVRAVPGGSCSPIRGLPLRNC